MEGVGDALFLAGLPVDCALVDVTKVELLVANNDNEKPVPLPSAVM